MSVNGIENTEPTSPTVVNNSKHVEQRQVGRLRGLLQRLRSKANSKDSGSSSPGTSDDTSVDDLLKKAKQLKMHSVEMSKQEQETPVSNLLTPEARADAQKVAKDVISESRKLLAGKDQAVRTGSDAAKGNFIIEGRNTMEGTVFEGSELGISRYTFEYHPDSQTRDVKQELWNFYPDRVVKTIRHESETYSGDPIATKGLTTEKLEADKDELTALLGDIKSSSELKDET
jgi:hypothetical protein